MPNLEEVIKESIIEGSLTEDNFTSARRAMQDIDDAAEGILATD